jgi:S1-C subfamily serine protease
MKNKKILLIIVFFYITISNAQTTFNPLISSTNVSNISIDKIVISSEQTYVYISFTEKRSNWKQPWVSFSSLFKIQEVGTNFIYPIKKLENNLFLNTKYTTKKNENYNFILTFPKLPPGAENINIVEDNNGFKWYGVKINNPDNSITSDWNEKKLKFFWNNNGIDNIEGIYENTASSNNQIKYKLAIKKKGEKYEAIYLEGAENTKWSVGDVKAIIKKTASSKLYTTDWYMSNKAINENVYTAFEPGIMKIIFTDNNIPESLYLKLYPISNEEVNIENSIKSSGTGFAITSNGYIATNYHVTNGANKVSVRGIKGDFSKTYNAKIIIQDKNNDLSIIKIDDIKFTNIGTPPYKIDNESSDVGNSVYALGYPLRATMGDEVKLTNGIISSKTGFQGDITSYQTSVPVQSGNSGGPLFDSKGNVIAIINAKHIGAENASYAIKTSYLYNLIQSMDNLPNLSKENQISSKKLSEQVKFIKEFVYIIEIN